MKIEIDTQKESKEDIKKIISYLQSLLDNQTTHSVENQEMFNLFSEDKENPKEDEEKIQIIEW